MATYKYVSWDLINEVSDGNQELIIDLVNMFCQQIPVYSEQLNAYYISKDYIALGKLAHKIKGSVSLLGITELVKGMKELEGLAIEGREPQRYPEYIDLFNTTCTKATIELNDILNRINFLVMINIEKLNDVLVVSLKNDNKLSSVISQQFKQEVTKLIDQQRMKILINLGGVDYIDSSGFGALLSILRASKTHDAQLKLCNISDEVMELVKLLQLHSVFDIRESVDDCIKSYKS